MKAIYILSFLALNFSVAKLSAQSSPKTEASKSGNEQQPVKKDKNDPKTETKAAPSAAPAKTAEKDGGGSGTQKMAITEQGVDKTKKKQSTQSKAPASVPKK